MTDLHGIIFAYRSDSSLGELTRHRNTCSLPFAGRFRLIDFMLSNYINAGVNDVGLIVHESYQSLLDHVGAGKDWDLSRSRGGLRILPPFGYSARAGREYLGSMDALIGVKSYLAGIHQEYIILARGDIAVNLPVADVFAQHVSSNADITVVCAPVEDDFPHRGTYFSLSENRVTDISFAPSQAHQYESRQIYILSKTLLLKLIDACDANNTSSFTRGVLQPYLNQFHICPYIHTEYTATFPSVGAYFNHSMQILDSTVRSQLFSPSRPIRTKIASIPPTYYGPSSQVKNSIISDGCFIEGSVSNCILSRGVVVEAGASIANCVLMQRCIVKADASLHFVVADKNVTISQGRNLMGHETYPLAIVKNATV